jgi:hypothetical protein
MMLSPQTPTGSPQMPVDSPISIHTVLDEWSDSMTAAPTETAPQPPGVFVCNAHNIHVPPFMATNAFSRAQYYRMYPHAQWHRFKSITEAENFIQLKHQ